MSRLLFDIGGTSMRMALGADDQIGSVQKIDTPRTPEEALEVLVAFAKETPGFEDVSGGIAGVIEDGVVRKAPHLPLWDGYSFAAAFGARVGVPVSIRNDAELAGIGEAVYGAGKGCALVGYVGVGTGVGGSLIANGESVPHAQGLEPGHQILNVDTGATFEELVSGSALQRRFGIPAKDLSHEVFAELTPTLAAGLYNLILDWSPEVLILGGSLINDGTGYHLDDIERALKAIPSPLPELPPVRYAALSDENGLYGALVAN